MEADQEGVLLYYFYSPLAGRQEAERRWLEKQCTEAQLVGRVRVAQDGLNSTLGGSLPALRAHIAAVQERYAAVGGADIDFKLAASRGSKSAACAAESGFTSLKVQLCKEVVALGAPGGGGGGAPDAARHVSPSEFHALLAAPGEGAVLVDCRNAYETSIGRFEAEGATLLDPGTRTFSDLPAWLEAHQGRLAGRPVLMYCTGGVRCERASAHLRSLGECFRGPEVVQLRGGIERYLEAFPHGGFFKGRNFVFDERVDVGPDAAGPEPSGRGAPCAPLDPGPAAAAAVGRCLRCCGPWDDYAPRRRCAACRMLVLLCAVCCDAAAPEGADSGGQELVCELCQRRRRQEQEQAGSGGGGRPPLRVLCLHGFRQTASSLHGRTAALRKRLRGVAEFVFADGPHALPLLLAPGGGKTEGGGDGRSGGVQQARPRRAWLITPEQHAALHAPAQDGEGAAGAASELGVDEAQRQRQTAGWAESGAALRRLLEEQGPFDGVMGFSQGAAVAAALCALQQGEGQGEGEGQVRTQGGLLKFAILCSGYLPAEPALRDALARARAGGGAPLPSLHVHAGGGAAAAADGQVAPSESQALAECFDPRRRAALLHSGGHVIPSSRAAAQRIRHFLEGVP